MKKYLKKLNFLFLIPIIFVTSNAFGAAAVKYVNTVYMVSLCETGSTTSNCLNPTILGSIPAGTTMDLGAVDAGSAAASMGNTSALKFGTTYTYGQVVLSRSFEASGSDGACQTSDTAASGTKTAFAVGKSGTDTDELQTIMIPSSTGNGATLNGSPNADNTTAGDSAAGALDADDEYIKFRWALASPFTPEPGVMPTMTISFDISGSLNFNGTCAGSAGTTNGITPGAPVITNSFN